MNDLEKLFSKTNLRFFWLLVDGELSVRELAESAGCSAAKASQALKQFQRAGLVASKNEKNKKFIYLNKENALMRQIISLLFVSKILNSKTFQEMRKLSKSVGVYGSVAQGTVDRLSDIDLWLLSEKRLSVFDVGRIISNLGKELGREASVKAFTKEGLAELKQKDKIFFDEIRSKSIILHGEGIE